MGLCSELGFLSSMQDDISNATSLSRHPSRPASRNAFDNGVESTELHFNNLHHEMASMDVLRFGTNNKGMSSVQTAVHLHLKLMLLLWVHPCQEALLRTLNW